MTKVFRHIVMLVVAGSLITFTSCVDDDLEFPEDQSPDITVSTALISFLNAISTGDVNLNEITISYPINLAFNSNVIIEITSDEGLIEAVKSQSNTLHITGVEFPVKVELANDTEAFVLENESDFISLLNEADLATLRRDFDAAFKQCFNMSYPVTLTSSAQGAINITSDNELTSLLQAEGASYQPDFAYPIRLEVFESNAQAVITSNFELYKVLNQCEGCPQLSFNIAPLSAVRYRFQADFPQASSLPSYDWFINDIFIESDGAANQGDNQITETLDPGVYEICMKAATPDCALGTEFCRQLIVEDPCPQLSFIKEGDGRFFTFTANFNQKDQIVYEWRVLVNSDQIAFEVEQPGGDNVFSFQFEPGVFEVCLFTETNECPQGVTFCNEIVVD